jgi:aspartoacylase
MIAIAKPIKQVAIVAGTHGNELTGIYLIKKFERFPHTIQRKTFNLKTLLANPKACELGKRYIDRDLNRCFSSKDLTDPTLKSYEEIQAKKIDSLLGPKGNPKVDAIVDLHSTTANMGLTVILTNNHPFNLRLAAYLTTVHPLVKVYRWLSQSELDSPFLRSICELGCTVEVGAIAQGILSATLFEQTEQLIYAILDYLEAYNSGVAIDVPPTLVLYQALELVDYPRNSSGELQAMIHPQLQSRDYTPLNPGDPMFLTFEGETIFYQGRSTVYPVFINESAYYEKSIAMCLTEKQEINWSTEEDKV